MWTSHVTYVNMSCHTCEWEFCTFIELYAAVYASVNESCHMYECIMSHMWTSHVTFVNMSSHTCEWVTSHIQISHVTHMHKSRHTYELVMSHIWMSHVTHMNESCHTYEWVRSRLSMSHVTHINESCRTYEWVVSHMKMILLQTIVIYIIFTVADQKMCDTTHFLVCNSTNDTVADHSDLYGWVNSFTWRCHIAHMIKSCHIYERVVSHIQMVEAWLGCLYQKGKASLYCFNLPFSQLSEGKFVILPLYLKRLVD